MFRYHLKLASSLDIVIIINLTIQNSGKHSAVLPNQVLKFIIESFLYFLQIFSFYYLQITKVKTAKTRMKLKINLRRHHVNAKDAEAIEIISNHKHSFLQMLLLSNYHQILFKSTTFTNFLQKTAKSIQFYSSIPISSKKFDCCD